jgi:hypothetical protein
MNQNWNLELSNSRCQVLKMHHLRLKCTSTLAYVDMSWDHFYKRTKNGVANLQLPCNQPQKIKAYPKGAHCILMSTLQICSTSISHFPSCSLQDFFKLKKMP